jgi:parvulin-like peptidyl-prolyl isomerase
MKPRARTILSVIGMLAFGLSWEFAVAQDLPTVKGKKIVASVNNEPITLDEFSQEVSSIGREMTPGRKVEKKEELDVLKRMINTRLIVQEARNIGLDKLPEVTMMVDSFSKEALREELAQKIMRAVQADDKEVERIYKQSIQEWRISAVLCEREEDAKSMEAELRTGKDFGEVTKTFIAERRAQKGEESVYVRVIEVDPQFAKVAANMAVGSTSSIIQTKTGFVILKLEDIRYTENAEEKEKARQVALVQARKDALKAFDEALKKKYVKVNRDLLKSIDYESQTPGFEALLKDKRVVAEIRGDQPVTVGELTEQLKYQVYHGVQEAAEKKKLNAKKDAVLDGLIHRKVFRREALRQGLEKTDAYRGKVREYETGVVFGMFINKVIVPDIKLKEDEVKAFYNEHPNEYAAPEMMKIRSLVFAKRGDAELAAERLRGGAEFQWVAAHAEGQVDQNAKGILSFDDRLIMTDEFPEGVRKAVVGVKAGDFRLYASPEGHFYVFAILDVVPSKPQPYDQARPEIAQRLFEEKQKRAVEDYADKLRSLSDVKVYLKG